MSETNESLKTSDEPFYIYKEYLCIKLKWIYILGIYASIGAIEELLFNSSFIHDIMSPLIILFIAAILLGIGIRMILDDFILKKEEKENDRE